MVESGNAGNVGAVAETEELAKLIGEKMRLLESLAAAGRLQYEQAQQGDIQSLLKVLATKQRLVESLRAIEARLAPHRDVDPETRIWASPEARVACNIQGQRCNALLADVLKLEQECEAVVSSRRDSIAGTLEKMNAVGRARGAYEEQQTHSGKRTVYVEGGQPGGQVPSANWGPEAKTPHFDVTAE